MSQVLEFSARTTTDHPIQDVRDVVERAFGLQFPAGEYAFTKAYVATTLGMTIGLFRWGADYILEARVSGAEFLEAAKQEPLEPIRVGVPVANMLSIIGPYEWRVPTPEDEAKDRVFGEALDRQETMDNPSPPWADEF